jgi:hypothetical protein
MVNRCADMANAVFAVLRRAFTVPFPVALTLPFALTDAPFLALTVFTVFPVRFTFITPFPFPAFPVAIPSTRAFSTGLPAVFALPGTITLRTLLPFAFALASFPFPVTGNEGEAK